jgi:hypothetical protein
MYETITVIKKTLETNTVICVPIDFIDHFKSICIYEIDNIFNVAFH